MLSLSLENPNALNSWYVVEPRQHYTRDMQINHVVVLYSVRVALKLRANDAFAAIFILTFDFFRYFHESFCIVNTFNQICQSNIVCEQCKICIYYLEGYYVINYYLYINVIMETHL